MSQLRDVTAPVFIVDPGVLDADVIDIDGPEGRHAVSVRRLQAGEAVVVTDGRGRWVSGEVARVIGKDRVEVRAIERGHDVAPDPQVIVLQAIPKGDRGETAVETLTEVGVDEVLPWVSERTQVRLDPDREAKLLSRWRATARESSKQARRTYVTEVHDVVRRDDALRVVRGAALAIVLDAEAGYPLGELELPVEGAIVVVVGPEGGLSTSELAGLAEVGAVPVRLGPSVLRTSTAGTVAAGIVLSRTRRWSINQAESDRTNS